MNMINNLRTLHTGDIQVEVRGSHQRYTEFNELFKAIESYILVNKIELYIIAGDVFEYCKPNDIERDLVIKHLCAVSNMDSIKEIVLIDGNHDVDQRKTTNYYIDNDNNCTYAPNALTTITQSINSNKINYMEWSGIYDSKSIYGLKYIVWGQKTKHTLVENVPNELITTYNPITTDTILDSESTYVTLYHDPINGCKMWDDCTMRGNDEFVTMNEFITPSVIAGDIHIPQHITHNNIDLYYCSSPVPRNFGEGDYYEDGKLKYRSTERHCINSFNLNIDGTISEQTYIRLKQYRAYTTFIISNETDVADVCSLNYHIENPGTIENMVRVKLPTASESYIALEQLIIEQIHLDNPNMYIKVVFQYGKGIVMTDSNITSSQDLHKLISEEKIVDISNEYIERLVTSSKSIPTEDKESVIKTIKSTFLSEIKNFTHDIPTNNISLCNIKLSNFMAFGDNISINCSNLGGIIKLTGANGIGKTTLYNAIKWVITGYISSNQNRTKKNENNLLLFNDYRSNIDEVVVEMIVMVNHNPMTITRTITRTWKRNVTEEQKASKNWKSYIASTNNELTIETIDGSLINDAAEQILLSVFGGIENLERIVFADQFTLKRLVCSDAAKLREEILNHIGMNFFDKMLERYDELRHSLLDNLSKPLMSVDQLNTKIAENNQNIVTNESELSETRKQIVIYLSQIEVIDKEINELCTKLYPDLPSIEELDKLISETNSTIEDCKKRIVTYNTKISELESLLSAEPINRSALVDKMMDNDIMKQGYTSDMTKFQLSIANYNTILAEIKTSILTRKTEIEAENNSKINELESQISAAGIEEVKTESKISELGTKRKQVTQQYLTEITNKKSKIESAIELKNSELNAIHDKIQTKTTEIETLKNSTSCPTCGRDFDNSTIGDIQLKIANLHVDIETLRNEVISKTDMINKLDVGLHNTEKDIATFNSGDNISEISGISEIDEELVQMNNKLSTIKSNIQNYTEQLKECKEALQQLIINDSVIIEFKTQYTNTSNEITNFDDLLKSCEQSIINTDEESKILTVDLERIDKYMIDIEFTNNEITTINKQISDIELQQKEYDNNKVKVELNSNINIEINGKLTTKTNIQSMISNLRSNETTITNNIILYTEQINQYSGDIDDLIAYRIIESSLKQYKTLIGKNGLPKYIFSIVKNVLNSSLNDLLEDLNFRLTFDDDNQLIMIDLTKPSNPIRQPHQLSGMQTCFSGLSLIYVSRMCNNTFIFDNLFIDEVSGQLNSGEELTYESMNYQEQLIKLLNKFDKLKVWVVDHVIDDLGEKHNFEVKPSLNGATLTKIG